MSTSTIERRVNNPTKINNLKIISPHVPNGAMIYGEGMEKPSPALALL
jgi:hypothetical protein